jgi:hypothetical protein
MTAVREQATTVPLEIGGLTSCYGEREDASTGEEFSSEFRGSASSTSSVFPHVSIQHSGAHSFPFNALT